MRRWINSTVKYGGTSTFLTKTPGTLLGSLLSRTINKSGGLCQKTENTSSVFQQVYSPKSLVNSRDRIKKSFFFLRVISVY